MVDQEMTTDLAERLIWKMMNQENRTQASVPLGAQLRQGGCQFELWAPRASRVELALVAEDGSQDNHDMTLSGGLWQVFVDGVEAGQRYGFRVHGDWDPDAGLRSNPAKLLVDPYARAITAGVDYSGAIFDHPPGSDYEPDTQDSSESVPLSVVVADSPPPEAIAQRRPLDQSVIYETHLRGLTASHPEVPEHLRGTFAGLAYPAVVDYLVKLGITAVELLPIHHFVSEPFLIRRGLVNYWGYNSLAFFAPHAAYCSVGTLGEQVTEFKQMVTSLHQAGIEVILDVVYNHTCEGNHDGPTLSFRGIDHRGYYRLTPDLRNDYDVTGCGNSVDTSHDDVASMIINSMRYWVVEMGVDGFRFDLATTLIRDSDHQVDQNHQLKKAIAAEPTFADIKLIAEPWDLGPFGYQVGLWGAPWSEWNDRFRDFVRDYWRGKVDGVKELAARLSGSGDLFTDCRATASINFVTAHDGFTVRDLVTYNDKHNQANGEDNTDGTVDNRSWNCGIEGETDDPEIIDLRHRQVRNLMATLLLADGVPMITAGDEAGRTQLGNNNAYCQSGPLSWMNWEAAAEWSDVTELSQQLIQIRAELPQPGGGGYRLAWLNEYSGQMTEADWTDPGRRLLGKYVSDEKSNWLTWFYSGADALTVRLPDQTWGQTFQLVLTTGQTTEISDEIMSSGQSFIMPPRTVVVMKVLSGGRSGFVTL